MEGNRLKPHLKCTHFTMKCLSFFQFVKYRSFSRYIDCISRYTSVLEKRCPAMLLPLAVHAENTPFTSSANSQSCRFWRACALRRRLLNSLGTGGPSAMIGQSL